jgi:CxxC motif-containing protein
VSFKVSNDFLYFVPQQISISQVSETATFYFRSSQVLKKAVVTISINGNQVYENTYTYLKPPEMETIKLDMRQFHIAKEDTLTVEVKGEKDAQSTCAELICIVCPNSCQMMIEDTGTSIKVSGNRCKRGEEFAVSEMIHPMRTISSTVKTNFPKVPVLPVRVSEEISKDKIFDVMREINKVVVTNPVSLGDIIIENVLGLKVNIIATSNILIELLEEMNKGEGVVEGSVDINL